MLYLHRYTFALIKPKLVDEWQLGNDQLGLLDSAFSIFYTGFQVPLGILTDVLGVHLMLTGMIFVWSNGLGMHAWANSLFYLTAARAMLGIGQAGVFASINRITRTWFPQSVRTSVQGWVGVFAGRFGGLSANLLVGALLLGVLALPWRPVVSYMAIFGVGYALLFGYLYRNSPRQHPWVNESEAELIEDGAVDPPSKRRMSVVEMFQLMSPHSIANLLLLNLQTILSTLADNIYSNWIPLFLFQVHQLKFQEMGFYSALPLAGGALGGVAGGWLNDYLIRRLGDRRWGRSYVGLAGKGTAGLMLVVALTLYDYPRLFCGMLFLVKFFSDWSLTSTWGTVTDIGGKATASVFAFNNSVAGIGSIAAPLLFGYVSANYGWRPVFFTAVGAYLCCGALWMAINCTIPVIGTQTEK